jgi:hypothetical protein
MKKQQNIQKELILEVQKDGFRRFIYKTSNADGSSLYLEESSLPDFSRPMSGEADHNVFFTKRAFWKSFIAYTSCEGLLKRQVWHESSKEWLNLNPVFIHNDIKHLVQQSLAKATQQLSAESGNQIDGIRGWLAKLAQSPALLQESISNPQNNYRHAV